MDQFRQDPSYLDSLGFDSHSDPLALAVSSPFDAFDIRHPSSPGFPATPSYNGSYQNSPYSAASELDFDAKDDLNYYDRDPLVIGRDEYDPSVYDDPTSSGLLMFDSEFMPNVTSSHVSLSVTHADDPTSSPAYYDNGSPSSSNGGGDSGNENDRRSPASSVSSHPGAGQSAPSPHLNFTTLHVESPYLPNIQIPAEQSTSSNKPQSPPQLVIPDGAPQPGGSYPDRPTINAPEGDGVGPRLQIVPATPVSGGDPTPQGAYRNPLLPQGSQQPASNWAQETSANSGSSHASQYGASGGMAFNFPPNGQDNMAGSMGSNTEEFLLPPSPSRGRSKSDTSLPAPQWMVNNHNQGAMSDPSVFGAQRGTVNLNDVLPPVGDIESLRPSSASALQTSFSPQPPLSQLPQPFASFQPQHNGSPSNNFLTADFNATALRRVKSEHGRPTHQRQVRSEDFRPTMLANSSLGFPPSSHQDFIARAQTQTQYLHPAEAVASITRGHHRRASSGSRERGIGGIWSGASSARASPYPSPNASPAHHYEALPNVGIAGAARHNLDVGGGMGMYGQAPVSRATTPYTNVAKVNVTTSATADASMKRRINDAKFMCPVPGCGSTFTRHFNLKGHMRSHNDEKPFQCKWPGCLKGFARQHDCKRHEQLHSNHRPFTCEGCKKPFARLDALNRHLRSEGGAGCAKTQDVQEEGGQGEQTDGVAKMEDTGSNLWGGLMM